jgi:hypothetical protein
MENSPCPKVLWLNAPPGTGKSILSSFVIQYLRNLGVGCCYFFFRFGDQKKRSIGSFLRSFAFQAAQFIPEFRRHLEDLSDSGACLEKTDAKILWQKLFISRLFVTDINSPLYCVIDALDESDSPQSLMALLSTISQYKIPIRLLIVSRPTAALSSGFERLSSSMAIDVISANGNGQDIHHFVKKELEFMRGNPSFKEKVAQEIINRAEGNFLWVHLALKEILHYQTQDEIERVLGDMPTGMQPLYHRMETAIATNMRPAEQKLAKALLMWATCSQRPLILDELSQALEPDFPQILDVRHTVEHVSGNFLVVDNKSRVTLVHQTAREYLTKTSTSSLAIASTTAHEELLSRCMSSLCDPSFRSKAEQLMAPDFVLYAASSWPFHLQSCSAGSDNVLTMLSRFLQGQSVLVWIHVLALQQQLGLLVYASQIFSSFAEKRRVLDALVAPNLHRLQDLELLKLWSLDLIKVVGKFGATLLESPTSTYKLVPQFCPRESIIYRQFAKDSVYSVQVCGLSSSSWDDSLAKVSVGASQQALKIICAGRYFAVLTSTSTIILWDSSTFQESRRIHHGERVTALCSSKNNDIITSYGSVTTKIWDISTGRLQHSISNPTQTMALGLVFAEKDSAILIGSDDRVIRKASLDKDIAS